MQKIKKCYEMMIFTSFHAFLFNKSNLSIASITTTTPDVVFPRCIGPKVAPAVLHLRWDKLLRYIAAGPEGSKDGNHQHVG